MRGASIPRGDATGRGCCRQSATTTGTAGTGGPYFAYFGASAGPSGLGYYGTRLGAWHIVSLNSEIPSGPGSPQYEWLKAELAASPAACTLAMWHRPLFTSGPNEPAVAMRDVWRLLTSTAPPWSSAGTTTRTSGSRRRTPTGGRTRAAPSVRRRHRRVPALQPRTSPGQQRDFPGRQLGRAETHAEEHVVHLGVRARRGPKLQGLRLRSLRRPRAPTEQDRVLQLRRREPLAPAVRPTRPSC